MYKLALSAVMSLVLASAGLGVTSLAQAQSAAPKKAQVKKAKAVKADRVVKRAGKNNARKKVSYRRMVLAAPMIPTMGDLAGLRATPDPLDLKSNVALVLDQANSEVLFEKNSNVALPIASITKMMTGLVVVEAQQDMDEVLTVTDDDVDRQKFSSSRLRVGAQLTRANMLHIALMSSENRAASALGRNYPGGKPAFVAAMNAKAHALGMTDTHYVDSSGLSKMNVASARDLAKLAMAAYEHPMLRQFSTDTNAIVEANGRPMQFGTTNRLVASPDWSIGLQKTGFINEAGRCLLMQAVIEGRSVIMVFLDSKGTQSRVADAGRIRQWITALKPAALNLGGSTPPYSTGM